MGWLEVGVESGVHLSRAILVKNPQEVVIQLALMMVLVCFFMQADVCC